MSEEMKLLVPHECQNGNHSNLSYHLSMIRNLSTELSVGVNNKDRIYSDMYM